MEGTNDPQNTVFLFSEKTFQHKQMTVEIVSRAEKDVLSYNNFIECQILTMSQISLVRFFFIFYQATN